MLLAGVGKLTLFSEMSIYKDTCMQVALSSNFLQVPDLICNVCNTNFIYFFFHCRICFNLNLDVPEGLSLLVIAFNREPLGVMVYASLTLTHTNPSNFKFKTLVKFTKIIYALVHILFYQFFNKNI